MNDLWTALKSAGAPVLLYGMGDGAEKLLRVCKSKEIEVGGIFCTDGFERGKRFHGMEVVPYSEAKRRYGRFTVLLAFGSAREEVLLQIARVADEQSLYIPDLPVAGETLFDGAFYEEHRAEFDRARALLADERSKAVFDAAVRAKLYGRLEDFSTATTTLEEDFSQILHPRNYKNCVDLGAYDGDSARFLTGQSPGIEKIYAFEPDEKTFARLKKRSEGLPVECLPCAAWDREEELTFARGGNRGSGVGDGKRTATVRGVRGDSVFEGKRVDFIKFDVEGAEKRALAGLEKTIGKNRPEMLISCYHRPEDLFELPLYIAEKYRFYRLYLRRQKCLPAWELRLYCI